MTPPYLCVLHLVTAGRGGDSLGSDRKEIVLLTYVMIDIFKNSVAGVKQYLVRPQVADTIKQILPVEVLTKTKLTDELVKGGLPLKTVIQLFEKYVRTKFYNYPSTSLLRFVTDGQLPLRQCLHPEALSKNIELPNYYAVFHDLRQELQMFSASQENPKSIRYIPTYFELASELQFCLNELHGLVHIVRTMISSGHRFEHHERIKLELEPRIYARNEKVDSSCVLEARGLPWNTSERDIANFFCGLNIEGGGIALRRDANGQRDGTALVRFETNSHRNMALRRHKSYIANRFIRLRSASGEAFIKVAGGYNNAAKEFLLRKGRVIIFMIGLPYTCTAKQVVNFFKTGINPCDVMGGEKGVLFLKEPNGRAAGQGFVAFALEEDATKALERDRNVIGPRYIELYRASAAEVQQIFNRSMETERYITQRSLRPRVPLKRKHSLISRSQIGFIRLCGLPDNADVIHITAFLGKYAKNIISHGVHMVFDEMGLPSGEAFIRMDSEQSALLSAQNRHGKLLFAAETQQRIWVYPSSEEDFNAALAGNIPMEGASFPKIPNLLSPHVTMSRSNYELPIIFNTSDLPWQIPTVSPMDPGSCTVVYPPILSWSYVSLPQNLTSYYGAIQPQSFVPIVPAFQATQNQQVLATACHSNDTPPN